MQVKIGEKIKELRKVTGRKQEDLATALGVTPQAISRWEANGGYPDMEMIPSIANYSIYRSMNCLAIIMTGTE